METLYAPSNDKSDDFIVSYSHQTETDDILSTIVLATINKPSKPSN